MGSDPSYALIAIDETLVAWAQEIVVMSWEQERIIRREFPNALKNIDGKMGEPGSKEKPIICLDIDDNYVYRDSELMKLIPERYEQAKKEEEQCESSPPLTGQQ